MTKRREPDADGRPDNPCCRWCGIERAKHNGGLLCVECDCAAGIVTT